MTEKNFARPDEVQLPLFVFGTLRQGEINHHLLAGRYESMVPAVLPGYRRVAPLMIARHPHERVEGELYFITPSNYREVMRDCDELEDIPPGTLCGSVYERRMVQVLTPAGTLTAWAYVKPER